MKQFMAMRVTTEGQTLAGQEAIRWCIGWSGLR